MKLCWEEGLLQADCYRTKSKSGHSVMEDRKNSETHLPESQLSVVTGTPGKNVSRDFVG